MATKCIKTVTPDNITTYHKYSEVQMDFLARLNKGRSPQNQTKYDIVQLSDEELLKHGIITESEAKKLTNKVIASKDAEIEALKKQLAEKEAQNEPALSIPEAPEPTRDEPKEVEQEEIDKKEEPKPKTNGKK